MCFYIQHLDMRGGGQPAASEASEKVSSAAVTASLLEAINASKAQREALQKEMGITLKSRESRVIPTTVDLAIQHESQLWKELNEAVMQKIQQGMDEVQDLGEKIKQASAPVVAFAGREARR